MAALKVDLLRFNPRSRYGLRAASRMVGAASDSEVVALLRMLATLPVPTQVLVSAAVVLRMRRDARAAVWWSPVHDEASRDDVDMQLYVYRRLHDHTRPFASRLAVWAHAAGVSAERVMQRFNSSVLRDALTRQAVRPV